MFKLAVFGVFLLLCLDPRDLVLGNQMRYPLPHVYPVELGAGDTQTHLTEYFQFHKSTMAFARVYFRPHQSGKNSGNVWMTHSVYGQIDFNSLLYRTHGQGAGKGMLFHFMAGCLNEHDLKLAKLMMLIDFPNNIYRFPVVDGPGGGGFQDFLPFAAHFNEIKMHRMNAKFAVGFADSVEYLNSNDGYTNAHVQSLIKYTRPLCVDPYTNLYVAFNAFLVGQSKDDVVFNFYPNFRRCRLLLYNMPKSPAINVRRLRHALLDHVNYKRMQVIVPGRSIAHRLMAQHNIAWAYTMGHRRFPSNQLPGSGLLEMLDHRVSLIRLHTYKLRDFVSNSILKKRPSYFFRPMTEEELRRLNFDVEHLPYLAQTDDWGKLIVLTPESYDHWGDMMKMFVPYDNNYENSHLPFMETYIFKGPNGKCDEVAEQDKLMKALGKLDQNILRHGRFALGFCQEHGMYTAEHFKKAHAALQKHKAVISETEWALMLEVGAMPTKEEALKALREILKLKGCRWVFLKDDRNKMMAGEQPGMLTWLAAMDEKFIVLMFNDDMFKVDIVYKETLRKEPEDLSNYEDTTVTTTTTTKQTTKTTTKTTQETSPGEITTTPLPTTLPPTTPEPTTQNSTTTPTTTIEPTGSTMGTTTTKANENMVWATTTEKLEPTATAFQSHREKSQGVRRMGVNLGKLVEIFGMVLATLMVV